MINSDVTARFDGPHSLMNSGQVALFGADPATTSEVASLLQARGYQVKQGKSKSDLIASLRGRPNLSLLIQGDPQHESQVKADCDEVSAVARERGVPVLYVLREGTDPLHLDGIDAADVDWVFEDGLSGQLLARADRLMARSEHGAREPVPKSNPPLALDLFPLMVHDLRTPLNVVGLSLRMVEQGLPETHSELHDDLKFIEDSFKQIERMLALLSDYARLFEPDFVLDPAEFDPRRLVSELIESHPNRGNGRPIPIHLEVEPSCPQAVVLDQTRLRLAVQYALANACGAARDAEVRVVLRGAGDRLVTEFRVPSAPPSSVSPFELNPQLIERLCGSAAERRGMELAIVARISQLLGGSGRLETEPGQSSRIVLEWPTRAASG